MKKEPEESGLFSLPFLLLFLVGVFLLAPLFGNLPFEGNVIAPPPPPPAPGEETDVGDAGDDTLPNEPLAPGETLPDEPSLLGGESLPDEPNLLGASLPDEPTAPGTGSNRAAALGTSGTSSSSSSSSGQYSGGGSGRRGSSESSVRGGGTGSGAGGGSGSRGTTGGGIAGNAGSTAPSDGSFAGSSPVPVQTTPPAQTQVVSPLVRQQPLPPTEDVSIWWMVGVGIFAALLIAAVVFLVLHLLHSRSGRLMEEQLLTSSPPGMKQTLPPLPADDPEIQEISTYLSDNMEKGYPLDALSEALIKNGFVKDKVKQVAEYLQQG